MMFSPSSHSLASQGTGVSGTHSSLATYFIIQEVTSAGHYDVTAATLRQSTNNQFATSLISTGNSTAWWPSTASLDGRDHDVIMAHVYFWLTAITSVLSIGGSLLLIATDAAFKDLRTPGRRLLTWLSFADCLTAIGNFTGVLWYGWLILSTLSVYRLWCCIIMLGHFEILRWSG